jgi:hypothetical protein
LAFVALVFAGGTPSGVSAGPININVINDVVADANHKDFEVSVDSDSNYTVDDVPKGAGTTNIEINRGAAIAPDKIPAAAKMLTVTWTQKITKGDAIV